MQYKLHASAMTPSLPAGASLGTLGACSDDSVDIDMEKLKAEAKEVACVALANNLIKLMWPNTAIKMFICISFYICLKKGAEFVKL